VPKPAVFGQPLREIAGLAMRCAQDADLLGVRKSLKCSCRFVPLHRGVRSQETGVRSQKSEESSNCVFSILNSEF
jgi:hypothetical protein